MTNTATSTKRKRRTAREPQAPAGAQTKNAQVGGQAAIAIAEKRPNKTNKALALLQRQGGATLEELVEATGWLPHTTRAALTGLKKKGHAIERIKVDGVSRYSVTEASAQ